MGPIAHFGETETLRRENREFTLQSRWDRSLISVRPKCYEGKRLQPHLNENEIPIGETELLGFVAVAMTSETRWRRIGRIGGAEFDFWFRSYVDVGRYLRVLEHITKHLEQASH